MPYTSDRNNRQRKTVTLEIVPPVPGSKPHKYPVTFESESLLELRDTFLRSTMTLRRNGAEWVNDMGVRFAEVRADRRPKPYTVVYSGMDGRLETKFATLAEAAEYVYARYQGVEYFDGAKAFHTDYGAYVLKGFALADIYAIDYRNYEATRQLLAVGDRVQAGQGADADAGRIRSIDGVMATVAWDSGVITTAPLAGMTREAR